MAKPIAIRAFNPLNIRPLPDGSEWSGQIGVVRPDLGGYCKFPDWPLGIRACAMQLRTYQRKHNRNTIREIILRWAPAADSNHPDNYIARVSRLSGYGPDERLDLEDWRTIDRIFHPMARVEMGLTDTAPLPYTRGEFLQGLELAGFEGIPQDEVRTAPLRNPQSERLATTAGGVAGVGGVVVAINEGREILESAKPIAEAAGGSAAVALGVALVLVVVGFIVWRLVRKHRAA